MAQFVAQKLRYVGWSGQPIKNSGQVLACPESRFKLRARVLRRRHAIELHRAAGRCRVVDLVSAEGDFGRVTEVLPRAERRRHVGRSPYRHIGARTGRVVEAELRTSDSTEGQAAQLRRG